MLKSIARREDLNRTTLGHIKHFLSGAFRYARRQGVLESANPMHDVEIPKARPAGETYAYTLEEEAQMLAILPEPAATVVATAAFTGARKGELAGLMWNDYNGSEIWVMKSVWRSLVDEPKRPKSKGAIPVIAPLKALLERHQTRSGSVQSRIHFFKWTRQPDEFGCTRAGCHSTSIRKSKPRLAWLACVPAWVSHEPAQTESFRQSDSTDSATRKRYHDDEHLREDGKCGRGKCNEKPGNFMCNYCATREWRLAPSDVKVV